MERKSIGSFIAALRRANGMTQKELAEKLSVSDKAVSRWERDDSLPDLMLLPVIADIFHITVDELLRGERKGEIAAQPEEKAMDTAAETARLKKQTKRVLAVQLAKLRSRTCIALCVGTVGVIGAIICNFGFMRGFIGFCVGVVCVALAAVMTALFCQGAWQAADDEELDADSVLKYRQALVRWIKLSSFILMGMLAVCIPFAAVISSYSQYLDVYIQGGTWLSLSAMWLAASETLLSVAYYVLDKKVLMDYALLSKDHPVELHGWCVKGLCVAMVLTMLWRVTTPFASEMAYNEGESFDSVEAFVTEMNARWETAQVRKANENATLIRTEYYDGYGNPISYAEANPESELYGKNGEVIATYHCPPDVMGIKTRFDTDGSVLDIMIYSEQDYRRAENNRQQRLNLITCIFAVEPLLALGVYTLFKPGKNGN